jgi:hypothetical protein
MKPLNLIVLYSHRDRAWRVVDDDSKQVLGPPHKTEQAARKAAYLDPIPANLRHLRLGDTPDEEELADLGVYDGDTPDE